MNTIEEILKKKREECKDCKNRFNILELCNITINIKNKAQCINYEKCMRNQCKTCREREKCENESIRKNYR